MTETGKVISKTSVEHIVRDDYIGANTKLMIDHFTLTLEHNLNDENFRIDGEDNGPIPYMEDIEFEDDGVSGVERDPDLTPTADEYGNMLIGDRLEADDEEAVDKYLLEETG
jgi:hypothetical protein